LPILSVLNRQGLIDAVVSLKLREMYYSKSLWFQNAQVCMDLVPSLRAPNQALLEHEISILRNLWKV
jgi:hypothetical protein